MVPFALVHRPVRPVQHPVHLRFGHGRFEREEALGWPDAKNEDEAKKRKESCEGSRAKQRAVGVAK